MDHVDIDFDALIDVKKSKIKFTPVSKYPSVSRDLAFVLDRTMPVQKVVDTCLLYTSRCV